MSVSQIVVVPDFPTVFACSKPFPCLPLSLPDLGHVQIVSPVLTTLQLPTPAHADHPPECVLPAPSGPLRSAPVRSFRSLPAYSVFLAHAGIILGF